MFFAFSSRLANTHLNLMKFLLLQIVFISLAERLLSQCETREKERDEMIQWIFDG